MIVRYAILGMLDGQELHGYRIKSMFERRVGMLWSLNFGQIYQILKDLRRRGLVEARFDRGTGHVGRWVYTITAKGRRALATWLARSPHPPQPGRNEILIRLLVVATSDTAARLAQVERQEEVYRQHVVSLKQLRSQAAAANDTNDILDVLATDSAIFEAEAHLRWLGHCSKLLKRACGRSPQSHAESTGRFAATASRMPSEAAADGAR